MCTNFVETWHTSASLSSPITKKFKFGCGRLPWKRPFKQFETLHILSKLWFVIDFCVVCQASQLRTQGRCVLIWFKLGIQVLHYSPPLTKKWQVWVWAACMKMPTFPVWKSRSSFGCFVYCVSSFAPSSKVKLCTNLVQTWYANAPLFPSPPQKIKGWVWVASMKTPKFCVLMRRSSFDVSCPCLCAACQPSQLQRKGRCVPICLKLGIQMLHYFPPPSNHKKIQGWVSAASMKMAKFCN